MSDPMLDLAARVMAQAQGLGAQEVTVSVSEGTHTEISRRERRVEQATESQTRRLSLSLLVDDRYSSHSTSDLRDEAVTVFLQRAVEATRFLEPDPDRALPPGADCGRGASEEALEHLDPAWADWSAADRAAQVEQLEEAVLSRADDRFVSATVSTSDGHSRYAQVASNGFADTSEGAWFSLSGMVTLSDEGGRRPEGGSHYATRHLADMPSIERIANEAFERADDAVGSAPIASGRYPMLLENRVAGRILGLLAGPISGHAIHHGRSCLADKLGETIGASRLTILDDPTIPRGLGSTPWDDDLLRAVPRTIVEDGVLRSFYLDTYYARRLGVAPTTGSRSNWVVPHGTRSPTAIATEHDRAILVTGFLGGNANPLTGDFSFGVRGRLVEKGIPTAKLSEMNVAGNVLTFFHQLAELADDPWRYGATIAPTLLFDDVAFSGT